MYRASCFVFLFSLFFGNLQASDPDVLQSSPMHVGIVSMSLYGHVKPLLYIGHELLSRGHEVSFYLPDSASEWLYQANLEHERLSLVKLGNITHLTAAGANLSWKQSRSLVEISKAAYEPLCESFSIKKPDLLVVDFLSLSAFDAADKFNITAVVSYPNIQPYQSNGFRMPTMSTGHSFRMNWFDRVINDLVYRIKPLFMIPGSWYVDQIRGERELVALARGMDQYYERMILCYNSFAFDIPELLHPLIEYVGPLQVALSEPFPAPKDVNKAAIFSWLDERKQRDQTVVYVSAGTTDVMNLEVVRLFYSAFEESSKSNAKLYFLWQLSGELTDALPYILNDHIMVFPFVDQSEVLQHESVKLFFSHCGINSVYESILAGKPILALPFQNDQKDNAARVQDRGIGLRLDIFLPAIKTRHISGGIDTMLHNSTYHDAVKKIQAIVKAEGGAVRAVDVLERIHAVGFSHLIPTTLYTPWWYIDQEIGIYGLYGCLIYTQLVLLRGIINLFSGKKKKQNKSHTE